MQITDFVRDKVAGPLAGAVIGWLFAKFQTRTARLRYWTRVEKIATSANDPVFGSVVTSWAGTTVRNLFLVTIEVENESGRDFKDVPLYVYTEEQTNLLSERTSVVNTPHIVPRSKEYEDFLHVPTGAAPTELQKKKYYHSREYLLPVFNRGQLVQLTYLCNRPNDDKVPDVFIHTQLIGARLRREDRSKMIFGIPNRDAMIYGLTISTILVIACTRLVHVHWLATTITYFLGLTVLAIGAGIFKLVRAVRRFIAG